MSLIEQDDVHPDTAELRRGWALAQRRRGLAESTIYARDRELREIARTLSPRSLLELQAEDLEQLLDAKKLTPRARYRWVSNVHRFFVWAIDGGLAEGNPTSRIIRPKAPRWVRRPIRDDDLARAIAEAPAEMRAMLLLAAYQGLRCQEIAGLQREDLLEANEPPVLIVTHGKGGHQRVLPLHPDVFPALRLADMPRAGWVFLRPSGKPYTPALISRKIALYFDELNIDATAHSLRHWFGTQVYRQSLDLRATQALLGHASPNTTVVYVSYSTVDARGAVEGLRAG